MARNRPPKLSDAEYRLLADFRFALRGFFAFSKKASAQAGLAPQQYQALLALRARRGREVTIGDLAEELYIRHHTGVELVDRLEKAGLMVRRSAATGRRVVLDLTPEAETVLASLADAHLAELRRYAPAIRVLLSDQADDPADGPNPLPTAVR
ncbi:MAG TPA: MarR family winged helix-turn-helix transcriptional regulator [Caulobacteraceae bacterium]|jgi:DNA-binding MarR family transcriptional regulator|nr:MarR family winged helix-turn-helix transcriptional regulator [Caulobacteraceae bacterium]